MDGDIRRLKIEQMLKQSPFPISGTVIAKELGVSRQVIVQDIALMRAVNKNILSTNKGYLLFNSNAQNGKVTKIIKVKHEDNQILDELYTIVDLGGRIRDVFVEHPIYGQISVDLIINCRSDAKSFVNSVENNKTRPLNNLTHGVHYHTIIADSEESLDKIVAELDKKQYLHK